MATSPALFRQHLQLPGAHGVVNCAESLADFQRDWFSALDPALLAVSRGEKPTIGRFWAEWTKGCGKDTTIAIGLLWLLAFCPRLLNCQVAAVDSDQADELRKVTKGILAKNEWLNEVIEVQNWRIINRRTESQVEIIAADTAGSHGARPDVLLINELAHISKTEFVENLLDNAAKVPHGVVIVATNAGFKQSWAWKLREAYRASSRWHFSIHSQPAPWIDEAELADRKRVSTNNRYLRLWWGVWTSSAGDAFEEADLIAAVTKTDRMNGYESAQGWRFIGGLDLGISHDHSGFVVLGARFETQRVQLANAFSWKPPRGGKVDLAAIQATIVAAHRQYKLETVFYDPYQAELMGQQLRVACRGMNVEPMNFVGANLAKMATVAMESFRSRRIDLYPETRLLDDLRRLTIEEGKSYGHRLSSTRDSDGHCDLATAFVIALPGAIEAAATRRKTIIVA